MLLNHISYVSNPGTSRHYITLLETRVAAPADCLNSWRFWVVRICNSSSKRLAKISLINVKKYEPERTDKYEWRVWWRRQWLQKAEYEQKNATEWRKSCNSDIDSHQFPKLRRPIRSIGCEVSHSGRLTPQWLSNFTAEHRYRFQVRKLSNVATV